jgi:hypothetical protein
MRYRVLTALAGLAVAAALAALVTCPAEASAPALRVTSPQAFQVVQRGADGRADIVVRGVSRGLGGRVQARWAGGSWSTGGVSGDGSFAVRLRDCPGGQATLEVRSAARPSVSRWIPYVGVGDIFVVAGQSNASGRGWQQSRYSAPLLRAGLFGNDDRWKDLRDPVDSPAGQVDKVSLDVHAAGSVWPLVATRLVAADPVPVAFVPCARGTTSIFSWLRDARRSYSRASLYGSMMRRIRAVGGTVRAVLFWQGEADARTGLPREDYEGALSLLAAQVEQDCGAPLVAAQIGDFDMRYEAESVNRIRLAQQDVWTQGEVVPGPVLYDVDLRGRVHFTLPSELEEAARRWAAAILAGVEHLDVPSGPTLLEASYDGAGTVTLRFDCGLGALRPGAVGGLVLRTPDGEEVGFQHASVTASDTVALYQPSATLEPLTVSLGSGREAAGCAVPTEDSQWALPALPFVDVPVAMPEDVAAPDTRQAAAR